MGLGLELNFYFQTKRQILVTLEGSWINGMNSRSSVLKSSHFNRSKYDKSASSEEKEARALAFG